MTMKAKVTNGDRANDRIRREDAAVMTPAHPRWNKFINGLTRAIRAEGCDASSLRLSERLLRGTDGIHAARSVEFFRANGGYCDCEVLANVDR